MRNTFGRSAWLRAVSAWSLLLTPACGQMQVTPDHPALKYDWNQKPGKPIAVRPGSITYLSFDGAETSDGVKIERRKRLGIRCGAGTWARWIVSARRPHEFEVHVSGGTSRYGGPKLSTIRVTGPKNCITCRCVGRGAAG